MIDVRVVPGLAAAVCAGILCSAAAGQTIRFTSSQIYNGQTDAQLFHVATSTPIPLTNFPPMPPPTAVAAGGQTGGGFVDGAVLVGECGIQIAGEISDARALPSLTFSIHARSWFDPGYAPPGTNSSILGSFGLPQTFNNLTVSGAGPIPYSISTTGNIPLTQFRVYPVGSTTPIAAAGLLSPGTYYFEMSDISVSSAFPGSTRQGTWVLTIPAPGAGLALGLAGVGALRRRR
ncbi:MAG: hypothetical protein WD749_12775 [Phycisphaerales bacterium]